MRLAWLMLAACGSAPPPIANRAVVPEQPPAEDGVEVTIETGKPGAPAISEGTVTRTYDNVVHDVKAKDKSIVVTLAGNVEEDREDMNEDTGRPDPESHATRSDDAARMIVFTVPAGVKLDIATGQHLTGSITVVSGMWAGSTNVELADAAGPVFQLDAKATKFEIGAVVPNAPKHPDDNVDRHFVMATLPTRKTADAFDGWSWRTLGERGYEVYGFAEAIKPGIEVNDWHQTMHFAIVRQPR